MEDSKDKYANLKDFMSKMGFKNITPNDDYLKEPENDSMGSVSSNKPIYIKHDSGNISKYNLVLVTFRSANYIREWASNFKIDGSGDHEGFTEARDIVYEHLTYFYDEHKNDFGENLPVKFWVVGYSRGAAVANVLAAKITDNSDYFNTNKNDIFCYTVGTPKTVLKEKHTSPTLYSYTNIHNIVSPADPLQILTPQSFGFARYGIKCLA